MGAQLSAMPCLTTIINYNIYIFFIHTSFNHPERPSWFWSSITSRLDPSLRNSSQLPDINRWRPNDGRARLYSVRSQHCHADQTALHAKHLHLCWAMRCAPKQLCWCLKNWPCKLSTRMLAADVMKSTDKALHAWHLEASIAGEGMTGCRYSSNTNKSDLEPQPIDGDVVEK